MAWALTGCRFGNLTEYLEKEEEEKVFDGYYESEPQKLTFCAETNEDSFCNEVNTNQIPSYISSILSNPVAFLFDPEQDGASYFFNPEGDGSALTVSFDPETLQFSYLGYSDPQILWEDSNCTSQFFFQVDGSISQQDQDSEHSSGYPTSGRAEIKLQSLTTFDGDCVSSLTEMLQCYEDISYCGDEEYNETTQESVQAIFNPFIEAEVLDTDEIDQITSLGYEVSYQ